MGRMKEFGMELAHMVHIRKMSDEQIVAIFMKESPRPPEDWLRNQIRIVKKSKMWKDYANRR